MIGDVVRVDWVGPYHVRFQCPCHDWPIDPRVVVQFRRFCDVLVHNYPGILLPHNRPMEIQPRPPTFSEWSISVTSDGLKSLLFAPPASARRASAHAEIASRARRALASDPLIGAALATVPWKTVHRLPSSSSAQRLLLHKLKGLRLSGWVRSTMRRGCPHCTEPPLGLDAGHTYHIVWHCPAARAMWELFCAAWSRLGVVCAPTDPALCTAVFSLRPLQTPALAWSLMGEHRPPADLVQLADAAITLLWQQQVLGCLQRIWQWRQGVQDEEAPWTPAVARSTLESSLRSAYAQVAAAGPTGGSHAAPVRRLLLGLQRVQLAEAERVPRLPRRASDQHLLFFDGGSRGNPGPGGSGAVVVRVDDFGCSPVVIWAASMSLANSTTTNNQAEYYGLVTGLHFAVARRLRPLTVIGDSALIIAQMRDRRAPKDTALRVLYARARILADTLGVARWRHHVRAFNTMADCAANLAMDSRRSIQTLLPTARPRWSTLAQCVADDVGHSLASRRFARNG